MLICKIVFAGAKDARHLLLTCGPILYRPTASGTAEVKRAEPRIPLFRTTAAFIERMARPERLELPTFCFVGRFRPSR